ncbi:MAG: ParB N-terminal domain-containing protein [Nitrosopumilaceae archaeon]|nr:ParB N-terminal domain-containing protein [Nitrosopumilaceae archaeon]
MNLSINPEYEKLVTPLLEEDYDSLKKSIKDKGLWMPIVTNKEGVILDGHHRFQICKELVMQPRATIKEFDTKTDEIIFVGECNLKRRQLTSLQRIEIVRKLEPHYVEKAKSNQGTRTDLNIVEIFPQCKTRDKLGEKANVSGRTYVKGTTVLDKASEDDIKKINSGEKTISKVYRDLNKNKKREERQEEIKKIQVNLPDTVTLYNLEFQSVSVPPNSVSLIFTDPPYHDKFLHLYEDLAKQASKVLREGGSLVCYVGQGNILKVGNMMEKYGLKFHWPLTVLHSGPSASVFGKKILVACKIMLWFTKGKYEGEFVRDVIKSEFQGKELHEWARSTKESDYYIKHLTIENEIVYDPFLGSGTFGVSAVTQNSQFIGAEVNAEHFTTAQKLLTIANSKPRKIDFDQSKY